MTDFFITLPSNIREGGARNTSSDYQTRLPEKLYFRKKWSVGLHEVLISGEILTVPSPLAFTITLNDGHTIECKLPKGSYATPDTLVRALNAAVPDASNRRTRRHATTTATTEDAASYPEIGPSLVEGISVLPPLTTPALAPIPSQTKPTEIPEIAPELLAGIQVLPTLPTPASTPAPTLPATTVKPTEVAQVAPEVLAGVQVLPPLPTPVPNPAQNPVSANANNAAADAAKAIEEDKKKKEDELKRKRKLEEQDKAKAKKKKEDVARREEEAQKEKERKEKEAKQKAEKEETTKKEATEVPEIAPELLAGIQVLPTLPTPASTPAPTLPATTVKPTEVAQVAPEVLAGVQVLPPLPTPVPNPAQNPVPTQASSSAADAAKAIEEDKKKKDEQKRKRKLEEQDKAKAKKKKEDVARREEEAQKEKERTEKEPKENAEEEETTEKEATEVPEVAPELLAGIQVLPTLPTPASTPAPTLTAQKEKERKEHFENEETTKKEDTVKEDEERVNAPAPYKNVRPEDLPQSAIPSTTQSLDKPVIFTFEDGVGRFLVNFNVNVSSLTLAPAIAYMCGFSSNKLDDSELATNAPDCSNGKQLLFIYSYLCSYSVCGNQKTNLLRVIPLPNGQTTSLSFQQIRYVGVRSEHVDSIRIQILDALGKPVVIAGYVCTVLHLRKSE